MRSIGCRGFCIALMVAALVGCGPGTDTTTQTVVSAQVSVATVTRETMRRELTVYGLVEYAPDAMRTVAAGADVTVEQVLVRAGDAVKVGQALVRVRGTPAAQLELQKARTDLSVANQALSRTQRLFSQHLATNADMTAARQTLSNARASSQSVTARLGSDGSMTMRADTDGTVLSVNASQGDTVAAGTSLLHLASGDQLYVRVGIEPTDIGLVRVGQSVELLASIDGAAPVAGTISSVSPRIDPQLRLAQALVTPGVGAALLPNADIRARITVEQRDAVLGVPRAAVIHDGDKAVVFNVHNGKASRITVTTGLDDGQRVEIVSGLKAGDRVVVEGNHELTDGLEVRVESSPVNGGPKDANNQDNGGNSNPGANATGDPRP